MSAGVVTDTHALIWYLDEPNRLSTAATSALDAAIGDAAQHIYLSSISLIEIHYLTEKNRIKPTVMPRILQELNDPDPVLIEVPVDRQIAQALAYTARADVPDMPDRIIAATAYSLGLAVVTRDGKIRTSGVATIW